jgi:hypothetical protein
VTWVQYCKCPCRIFWACLPYTFRRKISPGGWGLGMSSLPYCTTHTHPFTWGDLQLVLAARSRFRTGSARALPVLRLTRPFGDVDELYLTRVNIHMGCAGEILLQDVS